jgi:glutaredoxin-like protein NrdH
MTTRVVVFGRDECVQCDRTKKLLGKFAIPYVERNVDTDQQARQIVTATGKTQLPMVDVMRDGELADRWFGLRPDRIRGLVL